MPTSAEVNQAATNFIADTDTADAKINAPAGFVTDRHGTTTENLERILITAREKLKAPVLTLTDPVPENGTVEVLLVDAGSQVWQVVSGAWSFVDWLDGPEYETVADAIASPLEFADGTRVKAGPFAYRVDSTATAGFIENSATTAQKLVIQDSAEGTKSPAGFGAPTGGTVDASAELAKALEVGPSIRLPSETYLVETALVGNDALHQIIGSGWRREVDNSYSGSVIEGGSGVTDLLKFEPSGNDGTSSTDMQGLRLQDFAIVHEGTGAALTVDHIVGPVLDRLSVEGGSGVVLDNWAFFAEVRNCRFTNWSDTGLFIKGAGSQHAVTNCHISSNSDFGDVKYGVRTQNEGSLIQGGQINTNRLTDNLGIGVWFDNPFASGLQNYGKGGARGVLVEAGIGFKIGTAGNSRWDNVILEDIRADLGISSGIVVAQFTNSKDSQLFMPRVDRISGGGVLAKWDGAEAVNCGVTLGASLKSAVFDVDPAAVNPWVHFVGTMTDVARAAIHPDDNLYVTVDNVTDSGRHLSLGKSVRVNGVWNNGFVVVSDDAADSFSLPSNQGLLSITCIDGGGAPDRNFMIWYQSGAFGEIVEVASGAKGAVNTGTGVLSGTDGADGNVTVQYDRASSKLFLENRTGSPQSWLYQVLHASPDNM